MGDIFKAVCACGFQSGDLMVGCGMKDPTYYGMPSCCLTYHTLHVVRRRAKPPTCRRCKSQERYLSESGVFEPQDIAAQYNVRYPREIETMSENSELEEGVPEVRYCCPQCLQMTMEFRNEGLWD